MAHRSLHASIFLCLTVVGSCFAQTAIPSSHAFSENKGQWDSQVRFLAKSPGLNLWVTGEGLVMDNYRFVAKPNQKRNPNIRNWRPQGTYLGDVIRMTFVNAQPTAVSGVGKLPGDEIIS